jgi:hypothetical protein
MGQPPLRAKRPAGLLAALAAVALGFTAHGAVGLSANTALVGKNEFAHLEGCAKELAAKGCAAEVADLLDVMTRLGDDGAALAKSRDACSKSLDKVKAKPPASGAAVASIARTLHSCASDMTKLIAALDAKDAATLAEQILRVDDDQPLAHETLGQVFEKPANAKAGAGAWTTPEQQRLAKRRREIEAAIAQVRKLEIPLETAPSELAALHAIDPSPAVVVRYGNVQFHSTMAPEKLQRIVRRGLQAMALSKFLRGLPLEVPAALKKTSHKFVMLEARAMYEKAVGLAVAAKGLKADREAAALERGGYIDERGFYVEQSLSEVSCYCFVTLMMGLEYYRAGEPEPQPCLVGGHLHWLCLTLFGSPLPGIDHDPKDVPHAEARTSDRARDAQEEQRARDVANAGLSGARRWMTFLAARGEDPPWSNSFVDDISKLVDLDLVKSTFVVEYLQESSLFNELLRTTAQDSGDKRPRKDVIEPKLDGGLAAFEARFHAWLLPRPTPLVQRLALPPASDDKPTKEEAAALAALDRARKLAWDSSKYGAFAPMQVDSELSNACALHVRYLKLHPDQLAKWPDAHEEYPEQEGFSSEGCWAGTHSVIAPGVATAEEAVAGWMGTFYHRLPLLEPGLKRIGFSLEERIAVLDAASLVVPDKNVGCVVWPARDMKEVPTRFVAGGELPHPVPGVDEREFGYPITLQTTQKNGEMELVLCKGAKAGGPPVACHVSTPAHPTNPDLAPPGAFCLLPKARLEPRATYTVVATPSDGEAPLVWSFTTGE